MIFRLLAKLPQPFAVHLLLVMAWIALLQMEAAGQTVLEVNFDDRGASPYTGSQVEEDFGYLQFTNGVDEGRVQVVTGSEAYGGTGASLKVFYPAGGYGSQLSGAQWLVEFEGDLEEAYLSYRVKFSSGFDFVRGGKLPGLAGGSAPSGNAPADGVRGWSGRMMWLTDFAGTSGQPQQFTSKAISYAKHVNSGFAQDGKQEDEVKWLDDDGSQTTIEAGVWYTIRQRIVLNSPGQRDGILQIWLDGKRVLYQSDIQFRDTADLKIDRLFFSTFFGGGSDWQNTKDEFVYFDDFKLTAPQQRLVPEQYPSPQAAVSASNPGDTILLGSADWYGNLYIDKPLTIRGRGDARLMAAQGHLPVIEVDSDAVNIESMTIARGITAVTAYSKASRLRIFDCELKDNFGDAIRATDSRDVSVASTLIASNEGRGVFLNRVDGFYIGNCVSSGNGGAGFEIFSDNGFIADCRANNNGAGAGFFLMGSNSGFVNNVSENNQGMGFLMVGSDSVGFMGNQSSANTSFGVLGYAVDDSFFSGNQIQLNDAVGLILDNSNRNAVLNSSVSDNAGIGAYFSATTDGNYSAGNQYQGNAFSLGLIDEGNNFIED